MIRYYTKFCLFIIDYYHYVMFLIVRDIWLVHYSVEGERVVVGDGDSSLVISVVLCQSPSNLTNIIMIWSESWIQHQSTETLQQLVQVSAPHLPDLQHCWWEISHMVNLVKLLNEASFDILILILMNILNKIFCICISRWRVPPWQMMLSRPAPPCLWPPPPSTPTSASARPRCRPAQWSVNNARVWSTPPGGWHLQTRSTCHTSDICWGRYSRWWFNKKISKECNNANKGYLQLKFLEIFLLTEQSYIWVLVENWYKILDTSLKKPLSRWWMSG